ncbi:hypothetical protein D3C81_1348310 [compost metagenome]
MPIRLPSRTMINMLLATIREMSQPPRMTPNSATATAMVAPRPSATAHSRPSRRNQSRNTTSPVASARTINVAD